MVKDSNSNLSCLLSDSASRHPGRPAIIFGGSTLTYAQVDAAANRVANLLVSRGIEPGDKVALSLPNVPYFTIIYFGILKAGATVVPLNILLKPREVAYHLADSEAKAYFAFEGSAELPIGEAGWLGFSETESCVDFFLVSAPQSTPTTMLGEQLSTGAAVDYAQAVADQPTTFETVAVDDEDTAVILYTSGTTGQPKGAELRHRNMRDNALAGTELFGSDAERPDTYLCVLPLFHSFGQSVIQNGGFAYGGTVVMLPRFEAKAALGLMLANRVTFFAGVPTMYWGLLGALDDSVDVEDAGGEPARRGGRRLGATGRHPPPVQGAVRGDDPGGLRTVGDVAGGVVLAVRRGAAGRFDRRADTGCGDEADQRRLVRGARWS